MEKRIRLLDTAIASTSAEKQSINWNLCMLCQLQTDEKLINPELNKKFSTVGYGYENLSKNLLQFKDLGEVPFGICLSELHNEESSLSETMMKNKAQWHRSCYTKCNVQKLGRAINRKFKKSSDSHSPVKTRSKISYDTNAKSGVDKCFFCNKPDKEENLHKVSTNNIDTNVRLMATELKDAGLLAKLSSGDMFAIDAFYHLSCLMTLKNRYRASKCASKIDNKRESVHALVFGELVGYIEEKRNEEGLIPLFKLSDLSKMYRDRLSQIDPGLSQNVHSTRLKNKLLEHIPGLQAQQHGKQVLLMFNEDISETINIAISHVTHQDSIHLVRAAQIIRNDLQKVKFDFDGSFKECKELVPLTLRTLINMIME